MGTGTLIPGLLLLSALLALRILLWGPVCYPAGHPPVNSLGRQWGQVPSCGWVSFTGRQDQHQLTKLPRKTVFMMESVLELGDGFVDEEWLVLEREGRGGI